MMMRVSRQRHAGEAFYVHRRLRPPRDRPKPFQSFPDKTGVCIGEEVVKSYFYLELLSQLILDTNTSSVPLV